MSIAVVTGANKGIGFFAALHLAVSGTFSHVILGCRDPSRGQTAVEDLKKQLPEPYKTQTEVSFLPLTLGDEDSHKAFHKEIEEKYGKLDVLVNNAGIFSMRETTDVLNTNYRATFDLTQKLLPLLKKSDDARIVNVGSRLGSSGQISNREYYDKVKSPALTFSELDGLVDQYEKDQSGWGRMPYAVSKLFLMAGTKVLARNEPDILINCVCPGRCSTDLVGFMGKYMGGRSPSDGAKDVVQPVFMSKDASVTGEFFMDGKVGAW